MKEAISEAKPPEIEANFCIVTEWVPIDTAQPQETVPAQFQLC